MLRVAVVALLFSVLGAPVAWAHNSVASSSPAEGETTPARPRTISITFDRVPNPSTSSFVLYNADGQQRPFSGSVKYAGATVTLTPPSLDTGSYVLVWRSRGAEGHEASGRIVFSVITPSSRLVEPALASSEGLFPPLLRAGWYLSAAALLGALMAALLGVGVRRRVRHLLVGAVAVFSVARLVTVVVLLGAQGYAAALRGVLTTWPNGAGWLLLFSSLALLLRAQGRTAWIAFGGVVTGEVLAGHLSASMLWFVAAVLHLSGVLVWLGGIGAVIVAGSTTGFERAVRRFKPFAIGALGAVTIGGVVLLLSRSGHTSVSSLYDAVFDGNRYVTVAALKSLLVVVAVLPLAAVAQVVRSGRGRRVLFSTEALLLCVCAVLGASLAGQNPRADAGTTIGYFSAPDSYLECDRNPATYNACVESYYMAKVKSSGVKAALDELLVALKQDPGMAVVCHGVVHAIGREAFNVTKSVEAAYEFGFGACAAGYYHGVLEGFARTSTDQEFKSAMPTICANFEGSARDVCDHGVGHAVVLRTNGDAVVGHEFCSVMAFDNVRYIRCLSGMYMEWGLRYRDAGNAALTNPDALQGLPTPRFEYPLDLCAVVAKQPDATSDELHMCYEGAFFGLQPKMYQGLEPIYEAGRYCNEQRFAQDCWTGLGGEVYQWVEQRYGDSYGACNIAATDEWRKSCVMAVTNGWMFRARDLRFGDTLCALVRRDDIAACRMAVESYWERAKGFNDESLVDEEGRPVFSGSDTIP